MSSENRVPEKFTLKQNYPNPFNPLTTVDFELRRHDFTTLTVYNVLGTKVSTELNRWMEPGQYSVEIDGRDLPSGIYYYELRQGVMQQVRKMVLMK